jgi:hypothetical protein
LTKYGSRSREFDLSDIMSVNMEGKEIKMVKTKLKEKLSLFPYSTTRLYNVEPRAVSDF